MAFPPRSLPSHNTMSRGEETLSLAGCVAFYLEVYGRPTFLQRNLRKVLAHHQRKLLSTSKQGRRKSEMLPDDGGMSVDSETSATRFWNPKEIINVLERRAFSDHDPVLRIDITDIRDRVAKFRNANRGQEVADSSTRLEPIPALCSLTIWDSSLATKVEQTRTCTIYPHKNADKQRYASVELSNPFMVPLRSLHSESRLSTAGEITYSTQFVIMSVTNTETWPPVEMQLPVPKNPQLRDDGVTFVKAPLLVAKWTRLPYLPEKEEDGLMEIKALQDDKTYKPKLSLKLDAKWINADSPLETYNKEQRVKSIPKSEVKAESDNIVIHTEWIFSGVIDFMDRIMVSGYACVLCHNRRFVEATEFHFHLQNNHDRFNFDYSITVETNQSEQSVSLGVLRVDVVRPYHNCVKQYLESISWQKPPRLFDIEAYLKGDRAWAQADSKPLQTLDVSKSDVQRSISTERNRLEAKKGRKRAIEDIPNVIISRKRRFKVPRAPRGISFYRTVSKVPLVDGDELSESDDDINEEWLLEKHADTIDSFTDTLPKEKLFIQKFDRHMLLEDTCSDLHSEEAIVRFCKQNTAWLRRHDMKFEFAKKVAALALNRLVSNDVLVACWRIINDMSVPAEPQDDQADTNISNGTRTHRPDKLLENGHIYGHCGACKGGIYDLRTLLCCTNGQCPSRNFHLRCWDSVSTAPIRPKVWHCPSCTRNGIKTPKRTSLTSRPAKSTSGLSALNNTDTDSLLRNSSNLKLTNGTGRIIASTPKTQRSSVLPSPNSASIVSPAAENTPLPEAVNDTESSAKTRLDSSSPSIPLIVQKKELSGKKMSWQPTSDPDIMVLDSSDESEVNGVPGPEEDEVEDDDGEDDIEKEDSDYVNSGSGSEEDDEEGLVVEEEEEENHV